MDLNQFCRYDRALRSEFRTILTTYDGGGRAKSRSGCLCYIRIPWVPITPDGAKDNDPEQEWRERVRYNENEDADNDDD